MAIQNLDIFHSDGRLRLYEHWSIYALFCEVSKIEALVKIGMSSIIYDRLLTIRPGLSYPMSVCLHAPVGDRGITAKLEAMIHREFKPRNTRGEWFRFDLSNIDDKNHFHRTTKRLYEKYAGNTLKWKKIYSEQLTAYATMKKSKKAA